MKAAKIGAVFYVLWGVLHMWLGAMMLIRLGSDGGAAILEMVGTGVPPEELPQDVGGVTAGLLGQHAWNLLWFGIFGAVVGAMLNWRNSRAGYWANLVVISAADVGFIVAILLPGYIRIMDGIWGPVLWLLAVAFTTVGIRQGDQQPAPAAA